MIGLGSTLTLTKPPPIPVRTSSSRSDCGLPFSHANPLVSHSKTTVVVSPAGNVC
jgi:hypothetical protein